IDERRRFLIQASTFDVGNNADDRAANETVFRTLLVRRQKVFRWSHPDRLAKRILATEETLRECLVDNRYRLRIAFIVAVERTALFHCNAEGAEVIVAHEG